jgi:hypothetical protein
MASVVDNRRYQLKPLAGVNECNRDLSTAIAISVRIQTVKFSAHGRATLLTELFSICITLANVRGV